MTIVRLQGGLGNQLFQYAFAQKISYLRKSTVKFDISSYINTNGDETVRELLIDQILVDKLGVASIHEIRNMLGLVSNPRTHKRLEKFGMQLSGKYRQERTFFSYNHAVLESIKDHYFDGYWQSYKYFEDIGPFIRKNINPSVVNLVQDLITENSIAIHIRRGDYVNNSIHPIVAVSYYMKGIDVLKKLIGDDVRVYIFSDDIEWCKNNLSLQENIYFIDQGSAMDQFKFMTKFKYFIIANSTYSWWAAWLADATDKHVIAPGNWINSIAFNRIDFFPPEWTIL